MVSNKIKYGVFDSTGALLKVFNTFKMAMMFKISRSRHDWEIKQIK